MSGPVVGFDLDMTLVDSRPGIEASLRALGAATGRPVDAAGVASRLGPPITHALARWFAEDEIDAALAAFRGYMADFGADDVVALPGAHQVLAAVTALAGQTVVVSAKHQPLAEQTLRAAGLAVDGVVGDCWAEAKGEALQRYGASVYVGDHPADVRGARAAGATAVLVRTSVRTGGTSEAELQAADPDLVVDDLHAVAAWLQQGLA